MRRTLPFFLAAALLAACSSTSDPAGLQPQETPPAAPPACPASCERGVCDPKTGTCVDPWVVDCAGVADGECSAKKPYVCAGSAPPAYDCGKCGCPDGQTCDNGVCYRSETLSSRRDERGISISLPIDDYFKLVDELATSPALTFAEAVDEIAKRMHADSRRAMLSLGESHGSQDEQAVGLELVRGVVGRGFKADTIGVEGGKQPILDATPLADLGIKPLALFGDLTNVAYCTAATKGVGEKLNGDGLYLQYTGSGHTSQEACFHPEHYSICKPPHTAECVSKIGRKAITVMLFDPEPWVTMTDNALLWRAGNLLPDANAFDAELAASMAAWDTHFKKQERAAKYDATLRDRALNVRFVSSPRVEDVFFAFFPRPDRKAFLMQTFKAVWSTPALKSYLVANGMKPQDCSISWDMTPGKETYSIFCSKSATGKELTATLDKSFVVTDSSTK